MKKVLSVSFRRHTNKNQKGNATKIGLKEARKLGTSFKGKVMKGYISPIKEDRCLLTLLHMQKGIKKANGTIATGKQPIRRVLGEGGLIKDSIEVEKFFKKLDMDKKTDKYAILKFYDVWYSGKFPGDYLLKPDKVADLIIKDRIKHALRFIDLKSKGKLGTIDALPKNLVIENITHDMMVGALFQRLTGRSLQSSGSVFIEPRENISLDFYKNKNTKLKIVMTFRNNHLDVTNKITEILNS